MTIVHHSMKLEVDACIASLLDEIKIKCARQMYICRAFFVSSVQGCVLECVIRFWIYENTIMRGKVVCILAI
jgi:hypothetical protein